MLTARVTTPIAGGPEAGLVQGSGGQTSFNLATVAETVANGGVAGSGGSNAQVNVRITALAWANEITWNVDGGSEFGPYDDNSVNDQVLDLSVGDHVFNYFDSYGDGWHGGYWSLTSADGSVVFAGGETEGLVTGAGGEATFALSEDGSVQLAGGAQVSITVHIHTLEWANEVTWSVDDGQTFGVDPVLQDNMDYYETMTLSLGDHSLNYQDAYGDGWHGGYWEILPGEVDISSAAGVAALAGGPDTGLVIGSGGTTSFTLGARSNIGSVTNTEVAMHIHTTTWANEITWSMDGGFEFGISPVYEDNSDYYEVVSLSVGQHVVSTMDSYGDGWHGGWWEMVDGCENQIGGGETEGLVEGNGGEYEVTVPACGESFTVPETAAPPPDPPPPPQPPAPPPPAPPIADPLTSAIETVATDGFTEGHTTFRLSVTLPDSAENVYSIFGLDDDPMMIPAAFQVAAPFGADVGGANTAFFAFMPAAEYDSWITVGITEGDASGAMATIGIDFASWDLTSGLRITDGAVFFMEPTSGPSGPDVVVAQLTVPTQADGSSRIFSCGCQGRTTDGGSGSDWQEHGITFELP